MIKVKEFTMTVRCISPTGEKTGIDWQFSLLPEVIVCTSGPVAGRLTFSQPVLAHDVLFKTL